MKRTIQNTGAISVQTALAYLQCDWSVIPVILQGLASGKIVKRPAIKWQAYQHRRPTEEELLRWFGNGKFTGIGVITGEISNLAVIDIEQDAAEEDVVDICSPLESQTIRGGRHVFYRWTKPLKNTVRINDKPIDFRGDGGVIVLPPSHVGGREYTWLKKIHPHKLPVLPLHIERELTGNAHQIKSISKPFFHSSHSECFSATSSMSTYPKAHEGARNTTAARVSGHLCANMSPKLWASVGWNALCAWNRS